MRRIVLATATFAASVVPFTLADARIDPRPPAPRVNICGWIANPTPANWWITDRFGQWVLGTQGGEQVPGMDNIPDLSEHDWVRTNGYYGYGCACMNATVDSKNKRVLRIHRFKQKSLAVCRADRKLPKPE